MRVIPIVFMIIIISKMLFVNNNNNNFTQKLKAAKETTFYHGNKDLQGLLISLWLLLLRFI